MYALTLIELLIFWNAKGYENFTHLLILCRRTEDVWSASCICTWQQQWRKKNPLDYQTAAQRCRQLLIWSGLLENCGMLWKWFLQTSSFFFSFWLWKICVSITSLPASPLCCGGSGLAGELWWDRERRVPATQIWTLVWGTKNIESEEQRCMGEPRVSACPEAANTFAQTERELRPVSQHKLQRINAQGWQENSLACSCSLLSFIYFSSQC